MDFGEFIKNKRLEADLSLRRFCELANIDPSNWSKVERGLLPVTYSKQKLESMTKILKIKKNSEQWIRFFDFASLTLKRIPDDIIKSNNKSVDLSKVFNEIRNDIRISIPKLKIEKFKNLLLYLLEHCAGKPNVGETVLYKLLYFIDFNYYELFEEQLTGASYRKLEHGPVPFKIETILKSMQESKELQVFETEYYGYKQKRYLPLSKADLTKLKASEKEVADKVIEQLSDMTARGIKEYSHNDIPWKATKDNKEIDYELVFYRTPPYSQRVYKEEDYGI